MIQFYSPDIRSNPILGAEESVHCVRVLRKKSGDVIFVTDGNGRRYECVIEEASTKGVRLRILSSTIIEKSWDFEITIAVAPTKNADRMAWLVEKCTEIGVDRIIFIKCDRSERKTVNTDRLRRNAISAMNQSLKTRLPEISGIMTLDSILEVKGMKYFGYCDEETERGVFVREYARALRHSDSQPFITIAIGPEGDFTGAEVKKLCESGYKPVLFGNERLRTETAAIYATTAIHVVSEVETH